MDIDYYIATEAGKLSKKDERLNLYTYPEGKRGNRQYKTEKLAKLQEKMKLPESKQIYSKRMGTVEAVFGYIKQQMNFRQFNLRGLEKVSGEWKLIMLAYNMKRLWQLKQKA